MFAGFLLMLHCSFNLIINCHDYFYVLSERLFLKRKRLYDARVASNTKKEYGFGVHFL